MIILPKVYLSISRHLSSYQSHNLFYKKARWENKKAAYWQLMFRTDNWLLRNTDALACYNPLQFHNQY